MYYATFTIEFGILVVDTFEGLNLFGIINNVKGNINQLFLLTICNKTKAKAKEINKCSFYEFFEVFFLENNRRKMFVPNSSKANTLGLEYLKNCFIKYSENFHF